MVVEWEHGPLMVLAGAGTGKTTVVVERVRHLLDRDPTLQPENILVLTYNVRAAAELVERLEERLGIERAGRLWVHDFHSFGYRLLREHRAEAGLADGADMLDAVGQRLLLHDLRPQLAHLAYHRLATNPNATLGRFADMISRAKDELVTPQEFQRYAMAERTAFQMRHGVEAFDAAVEAIVERQRTDRMWPLIETRRSIANGEGDKGADRAARREASGINQAVSWTQLDTHQRVLAGGLKRTFLRDAEALEVLRLTEEAEVYARYQAELRARGVLDFGEQMALTIALLVDRPNLLLGYQRQFRHVLVDEFQDANMAQIALLELIGRGPDKPDDVVVVGDDDQSIYRFRGASYAAFERFRERFAAPPVWAPDRPPCAVASLPLLDNRRSTGRILDAADRLIGHNIGRLKLGQPLRPTHEPGDPVELIFAADEADEAELIVERIRNAFLVLPEPRRWSDIAVLYRRHRHREVIVDRLRRAGIPYALVGGTGLFLQPEIRDLEACLRVFANPEDSVSFSRLLTAAPWRLDATELLRVSRAAAFDGRPMFQAALEMHQAPEEQPSGLSVKLGQLFGAIDDLVPRATREGPFTLLEELLVRTGLLHDLIATETPDAQRTVLAVARLLRFTSDWQRTHPRDNVVRFIAWLDLYQEVGGDLETESSGAIGIDGVQLMTIYQAKGLEYEVVIVPRLVDGQFPDTRAERPLLPVRLLKQVPPADFEAAEERRLCFVAMTRARRQLLLTTIAGSDARARPSRFLGEIAPGDPDVPEGIVMTRRERRPDAEVEAGEGISAEQAATQATATLERVMPVPAAFERRYALRRRAVELVGTLESLGSG